MGESADMALEGHLCQGCGEYMEGGQGFARWCESCLRYNQELAKPVAQPKLRPAKTVKCTVAGCMRNFATAEARDQHIRCSKGKRHIERLKP